MPLTTLTVGKKETLVVDIYVEWSYKIKNSSINMHDKIRIPSNGLKLTEEDP